MLLTNRNKRQTSKTELPTTRESRFSKGNRRNAYAMLTVSRLSSIYIKILEEQKSEKLSEK
ncbi:uncharacterized protein isoform X2 [Bombus fervidus]|uniref:uncharacterized protein isoform X2 n=1 Tax=Bombus fervidus TaxID=203811 RepID=UPI003D18791C